MALINCSECNRGISENAKSCPNCGNPVVIKKKDEGFTLPQWLLMFFTMFGITMIISRVYPAYIGTDFSLVITGLIILFIVLIPLFALVSALKNNFHGNEKLVWVLIILFIPFLGALLYFLIGRGKRIV